MNEQFKNAVDMILFEFEFIKNHILTRNTTSKNGLELIYHDVPVFPGLVCSGRYYAAGQMNLGLYDCYNIEIQISPVSIMQYSDTYDIIEIDLYATDKEYQFQIDCLYSVGEILYNYGYMLFHSMLVPLGIKAVNLMKLHFAMSNILHLEKRHIALRKFND